MILFLLAQYKKVTTKSTASLDYFKPHNIDIQLTGKVWTL